MGQHITVLDIGSGTLIQALAFTITLMALALVQLW
jgi:hypothetical protein